MSYMDALWIKITNCYSKWPPLARTKSLSLCGHSSIELCNTSTGKPVAAFRRDRFKLSILGCLFLQHPFPWTELELPAGLSPSAWTTQQWQETNVPDFISPSGPKPLGLQIVAQASGDACKKRHPNIESLKWSLRKAAVDFPVDVLSNLVDEWTKRLKNCVRANGGHFE